MLLPVHDICAWLRQSAATLRDGGAEASAIVYEEIADRLENEGVAMSRAYRHAMADIRDMIAMMHPNGREHLARLDSMALVAVPRRWVE